MKQKTLLYIVQSWKLNKKPEYRGFKCGNCQRALYRAWHHWCTVGDYKTPVHLCNDCELLFRFSKIKIDKLNILPDRIEFSLKLPDKIVVKLKEITKRWSITSKPVYKTFTCDDCGKNIHKAYHFWFKIGEIISEAHFCKKCGNKLGLSNLK